MLRPLFSRTGLSRAALRCRSLCAGTPAAGIAVRFGSQTGTASMFASQIASALGDVGKSTVSAPEPLGTLSMGDLRAMAARGDTLVVVASCYGRGEPTDNARDFFYDTLGCKSGASGPDEALAHPITDELRGLRYAVFGLGASGTHGRFFNVVGKTLDAMLERRGAERVHPFAAGDDSGDVDDDFDGWQEAVVPKIMEAAGGSGAKAAAAPAPSTAAAVGEPAPGIEIDLAAEIARVESPLLPCRISRVVPQCVDAARPSVSIGITLDADGQGDGTKATFSPWAGDHVAILPRQEPAEVDRVMSALGSDDANVRGFLERAVDLAGPVNALFVREIAKTCAKKNDGSETRAVSPAERAAIEWLATSEGLKAAKAHGVSVADLCVAANSAAVARLVAEVRKSNGLPASEEIDGDQQSAPLVDLSLLARAAPRVQPRMYSAANPTPAPEVRNSPNPSTEAELLFRPLLWNDGAGRVRKGLCSHWLSRLSTGDTVLASVRRSDFHVDDGCSTGGGGKTGAETGAPVRPVVMFAGGTGVAPFKGLLSDISGEGMGRKVIMFIGARTRDEVPYLAEFEQFARENVVDLRVVADASLDALPSAIDASGDELWEMIDGQDGLILVCGGATGFGRAMVRCLKKIIADRGVKDVDAYFEKILVGDRYLEDVADN